MKLVVSLSILVTLVSVFNEGQSYKACKNLKPVEDLDTEWYFGTLKKPGQYVIATSECQNCENGDEAFKWLTPRTTPTKCRFKLHGVTPSGWFSVDGFCEFANPEKPAGNCALDFTKYETTVKMKGSITVFLTDNSNYMVTNFCIFGKENLWYITSPKPKLDSKMKQEIIDKIVELGFDGRVAVEGVSPVVLKNVTVLGCS